MKTCYSFLLLICICLTACAPIRVVRLEPEEASEIDSYLYGNPVQQQEHEGIVVDVSYYDASKDYIVFNVEIDNQRDSAFLFDPVAIFLAPNIGPAIPAIDPELQLLSMDLNTARDEQASRTFAWIGAGLIVAGTVAAIADDNTALVDNELSLLGDISLSVADALLFSVIDRSLPNSRNMAAPDETPIPENRFFWLDHSLRITTIEPGERALGKVAFRRNDQVDNFEFVVPIGEKQLAFPFLQRVFPP